MELGLDPTLPRVPFLAGGRTYHLCFDFNAIVRAEAETGINLLAEPFRDIPNATILRAMLWASLLHENPTMTIAEAGSLLSKFREAGSVYMLLAQAWSGSIPEPDEDDAEGKETAQATV